mmetsp:Transcript_128713/g.345284  ORF Transcript_128713/g.345284 Transcript_128713/m.345284 type:complete len:212 (-) Transcript_128713:362-997(-)
MLHPVDVGLRHGRLAEGRVDLAELLVFLLDLLAHAAELVPALLHLAPEHLQHRIRIALAVLLLRLAHLAQPRRPLHEHLLRRLQSEALLLQLLRQAGLLLLLLPQHGRHLQQLLEALVPLGLLAQELDLLLQLLALGVELLDLGLEVLRVQPALALLLHVRVHGLELRLQLLVGLVHLKDLLLAEELFGDLQVHAEAREVGPLPECLEVAE